MFSIICDSIPKPQVVFLLVKYPIMNSAEECNLFTLLLVVSEIYLIG